MRRTTQYVDLLFPFVSAKSTYQDPICSQCAFLGPPSLSCLHFSSPGHALQRPCHGCTRLHYRQSWPELHAILFVPSLIWLSLDLTFAPPLPSCCEQVRDSCMERREPANGE